MSTFEEKSYHHGDLRSALLKTGREELEAKGQDSLSLRETARKIGVSPNAPYRHFADKEAFLRALAIEGFEELADDSARAADRKGIGMAYIRFAEVHPRLFTLMFSPLLAGCSSPDLFESSMKSFRILLSALETNDPCDPRAIRAWGLVHGLATLRINGMLRAPGMEEAMQQALREI